MTDFRPILLGLLLIAGPAWASEDAPVSTSAPVSVAEQIDAYLKAAPPISLADEGPGGTILTRPDRRPHGMAEVSVGTGGYRSVYLQSVLPVGKSGTLSIGIQQSRSRNGHGRAYGYGGYGCGPHPYGYPEQAGGWSGDCRFTGP